jgi:hypothetical protein
MHECVGWCRGGDSRFLRTELAAQQRHLPEDKGGRRAVVTRGLAQAVVVLRDQERHPRSLREGLVGQDALSEAVHLVQRTVGVLTLWVRGVPAPLHTISVSASQNLGKSQSIQISDDDTYVTEELQMGGDKIHG